MEKKAPPLRRSRAKELNALSREYLEGALREARKLLPQRVYAVLHQAAMSSAGGRRRKLNVNSVHTPSPLEEVSVFKFSSSLSVADVERLADTAEAILAVEKRACTHSDRVELFAARVNDLAEACGVEKAQGAISDISDSDLLIEHDRIESAITKRAESGASIDDALGRLGRVVEEIDARGIAVEKEDPSTPADPDERRRGSQRNEEGSASGSRGGITISDAVETSLQNKVDEHNEKHGQSAGKRVTLGQLKAVYRRGAGAFSSTHRPSQNRASWSMARVNAYLKLLRSGRPDNPKYTTDNDLLPKAHPRSTKKSADSFTPPQAVRNAAQRALDVREEKPESQRGMTAVGIARARDLANGRPQSLDTIRRMVSFFDRHEVDKQGSTWDEKGKGWQAWHGWGGDAGRRWAEGILRREERTEKGFLVGSADGGAHAHALNRRSRKTFDDGAHRHVFKLPGTGQFLFTDEDGSHEHSLSGPFVDKTETDGAHSHRIVLSDGTELMTAMGGAHLHSLQAETTNFSSNHQHVLVMPDGTEITSLTIGEYLEELDLPLVAPESVGTASRVSGALARIETLENQVRELVFEPGPDDDERLRRAAMNDPVDVEMSAVPMVVVKEDGPYEVAYVGGETITVDCAAGIDIASGDTVMVDEGVIVDFAFDYAPIDFDTHKALKESADHGRRINKTLPFYGPDDAVVCFVVERPSTLEHARSAPFAGANRATFVDRYLDRLGKTFADVRVGYVVPTILDYGQLAPETQALCKAAALAQVPPGAVLVGVGKGVRDALGDALDFWVPHPSVIRKRTDSGEVGRKMRHIAAKLDKIKKSQDTTLARESISGLAEASGTSQGATSVQVVKSVAEKRIVYGIVLDPYIIDLQNDWLPPAEIEQTAHNFMKSSRVIGLEHKQRATGAQVVESFIELYPSTEDRERAFKGMPHRATRRKFGDDTLHSGAWVLGVQLDEKLWKKHLAGEIDAFSIGGFSVRSPTERTSKDSVTFVDMRSE